MIPVLVSLLTLVLSVTVIYGWFTMNPIIVQINENWVPMQFSTALCFAELAVALLMITFRRHKLAVLGGLGAFSLGALSLYQYAFGFAPAVNKLFLDPHITVNTVSPGLMSPGTAICFVLLSGTMLLRKLLPYWFKMACCAVVMGTGAVVLIGYAMSNSLLYGFGGATDMAVHTAIGFAILPVGLLVCLRKQRGDLAV